MKVYRLDLIHIVQLGARRIVISTSRTEPTLYATAPGTHLSMANL
jgi:hypothetical protein